MQIHNSLQSYSASHTLGSRSSTAAHKTDNIEGGKNNTATVTISSAGQNASEKLQTIANKYDVTNISTTERIAMAQELNNNGLLPDDVMIFMMAPLSMNEDMGQKSNYLSTIRESFEVASKMGGSTEQLALKKQRLNILEQLNALALNKSEY